MTDRMKLPIGIQTFENLIEEHYYYVDKTKFITGLSSTGKYYFLARPRRFGKSLFLSTIKAAFQARKDLFEGLYIETNWDWEVRHPVIHISFGSGVMRSIDDLQIRFAAILKQHEKEYGITLQNNDPRERFAELISALCARFNEKVIILVDEYDKPILDNIDKKELAIEIREEMKNYYSVIKDSDPYIQFVFITGVSKFSKISLFSGLNNLNDISMDHRYSAICGYTQGELESVFADRLSGIDMAQVQSWYNGYNWLGEKVYNPFDILLLLDSGQFSNYWFETGTPSFLIKLLQEGRYDISQIENLRAGEEIVGSFDVEDIAVETLLFQTGYLTLTHFEQIGSFRRYTLSYPNLEVKSSLCNAILNYLGRDRLAKTRNQSDMLDALMANDLDGLRDIFHSFFASIPHDWYRKNKLAGYEGYYASIVYCYFASLGLDVRPEHTTNKGRIDLVLHFQSRIYIIEFKVMELAGSGRAMEQILKKGYPEQFAAIGAYPSAKPNDNADNSSVAKSSEMPQTNERRSSQTTDGIHPIYLIGVEFSNEKKNIVGFEWQRYTAKL